MTRHTRVRQLHKFRGTKPAIVQNEPIKDAVAFYMGLEDFDASFHKVTLINLKKTYGKTLLGNYRLQKKLQKIEKNQYGKVPTLWDIIDRAKKNPKLLKKYKYHLYEDGEGRFYTYELGRKTIYGFVSDYDNNKRVYFDKLGDKYYG